MTVFVIFEMGKSNVKITLSCKNELWSTFKRVHFIVRLMNVVFNKIDLFLAGGNIAKIVCVVLAIDKLYLLMQAQVLLNANATSTKNSCKNISFDCCLLLLFVVGLTTSGISFRSEHIKLFSSIFKNYTKRLFLFSKIKVKTSCSRQRKLCFHFPANSSSKTGHQFRFNGLK